VLTLADTLFEGRLGPAARAGAGVRGIAFFTTVCFGMGLLRGVKLLISQARGGGAQHRELPALGAGLIFALAFGGVALLLGEGIALFLPLLTESEASGSQAQIYLGVRILSAPALTLYVALREARYGQGDARSPMIASVVGNGVNIVLDAIFILGLDWGVGGAAAATVVAHVIEAVILVRAQWGEGFGLRLAGRREFAALWQVGFPTGIQFTLEVGSFAMLTLILAGMGDMEVAAHQIALQVIHFGFLPTVAVGEAVSVMSGQAIGARRMRLVRSIAFRGLGVVGIYSLSFTVLLVAFGSTIAAAFTDEPLLLERTATLLLIAAVFQIADGAQVVARGTLRGTGDVRFAAFWGIVTAWALTPPAAYFLGSVLGWGAVGGWIGLTFEIMVAAAIFWVRLTQNGWLRAARRSRALSVAEAAA
jgi:MATE family multidrug resistance protein